MLKFVTKFHSSTYFQNLMFAADYTLDIHTINVSLFSLHSEHSRAGLCGLFIRRRPCFGKIGLVGGFSELLFGIFNSIF